MKAITNFSLWLFVMVLALVFSCDPYKEGNQYLRQRNYQKAIEYFETKLKEKPNDPVLHNQLGYAYSKLGKYKKAIEHYQKAVELKPDYSEAHYNLGHIYAEKTVLRLEDAIKELTKAIELRSDYAKAYNDRGLVYAWLGDFEKAKQDLQKALKLDPENETYKYNMEYCQRMEEIFKAQQKTRSQKPQNPEDIQPQSGKTKKK